MMSMRKRLLAAAALLALPGAAAAQMDEPGTTRRASPPPAAQTLPPCEAYPKSASGAELKVWYGQGTEGSDNGFIAYTPDNSNQARTQLKYALGGPGAGMKVAIERVVRVSQDGSLVFDKGYRLTFLPTTMTDTFVLEADGQSRIVLYGMAVVIAEPNGSASDVVGRALLTGKPVRVFANANGRKSGAGVDVRLDAGAFSRDEAVALREAKAMIGRRLNGQCEATSDCFLTTATVGTVGLEDDCWELTTLRRFRDGFLAGFDEGRALIADYYVRAPRIVAAISARSDARRVWLKAYFGDILPSAAAARLGMNGLALRLYRRMTLRLEAFAAG